MTRTPEVDTVRAIQKADLPTAVKIFQEELQKAKNEELERVLGYDHTTGEPIRTVTQQWRQNKTN